MSFTPHPHACLQVSVGPLWATTAFVSCWHNEWSRGKGQLGLGSHRMMKETSG